MEQSTILNVILNSLSIVCSSTGFWGENLGPRGMRMGIGKAQQRGIS